MFGPLMSAGLAIGGKLLDMHQAKKAEKFNPILKRVQDAKQAGVHPIYALGAGGIAQSGPAQVAFGETLSKMGQNIGSAIDRNADTDSKTLKSLLLTKAQLENELLSTQVTKAKADMVAQPTMPKIDQPFLAGLEGQGPAAIPGTFVTDTNGKPVTLPKSHKIEPPQHTPNLMTGFPWRRNPNWSDGQTFEDAYGEGTLSPAGPLGWAGFLADVKYNIELLQKAYPPKELIYDKLRRDRARDMHYKPEKDQSRLPERR